MTKPIPDHLVNSKNKELLHFLEPLSCHGDIIEPLEKVLRKLSGWESFCPEESEFRYCFWYLNNMIFAFAVGMQNICVRISEKDISEVSKISEKDYDFDGDMWFSIKYNHDELETALLMAFEYANNT